MEDTSSNQNKVQLTQNGPPFEFFGIFGMMDFPTGSYLILIDKALIIGEILKCHVFRVESLLFIPLNNPVQPFRP